MPIELPQWSFYEYGKFLKIMFKHFLLAYATNFNEI